MTETKTMRDPFLGKDVEISARLTDRLRGRYAIGPTMPDGEPEFGWRQFETPPIQHEAAIEIERLQAIIDSRPAVNAALPESYVKWSQSIYEIEAVRAGLLPQS